MNLDTTHLNVKRNFSSSMAEKVANRILKSPHAGPNGEYINRKRVHNEIEGMKNISTDNNDVPKLNKI